MTIRYTPQARQNLRELEQYLSVELKNPGAARNVVGRIVRDNAALKRFPHMGMSLAAKTGIETDLLYRITGKHLVFYRNEDQTISIARILDGRQDYMKILFPGSTED